METFQRPLEDAVNHEVEPIIKAMGFIPVEVKVGRTKNQSIISIVIYRSEGVGVDDCAKVSKNIYPRLELVEELGNFSLEVSSPGIGRILRTKEEYKIFQGRAVSILTSQSNEWLNGIIDHVDDCYVFLNVKGNIMSVGFDVIKKAKLAYSLEEGK
jgi:ribosome maturation factor RimP